MQDSTSHLINIHVRDALTGTPTVPNTGGWLSQTTDHLSQNTLPTILIILTLTAIIATIIILLFKHKSITPKKSIATLTLILTVILSPIATSALETQLSTISDPIDIYLQSGQPYSDQITIKTTVTNDSTLDHQISAKLDSTIHPAITISIADTTLSTNHQILTTHTGPTTGATELNHNLNINIANTLPVGDHTINITFTSQILASSPTITAITPSIGHIDGLTPITITGTNLNYTTGITIGNAACTDLTIQSATAITCNTPPNPTGSYDMTITNELGNITKTNSFTYVSTLAYIVPTVASTIPPSGNGTGTNGPQFSLAGTNFGSNPTVTIGNQPCTDITVNSTGTAMTCTGPTTSLSAGPQDVKINGQTTTATVTYDDTDYPTLQSLTTSGTCQGIAGNPAIYRDARDSQLYHIAKLVDNKCWMLDNLRYKPNGDTSGTATPNFSATQIPNVGATNYLTQSGTSSTSSPNQDSAKYIDPVASDQSNKYCQTGTTNISSSDIARCGLLYNFYTATAGTAPQDQYTGNPPYNNNYNASGSICPTNWHLPSGGMNTNSDYSILNASIDAGTFTSTGSLDASTNPAAWQHNGAFQNVFSGYYDFRLFMQGLLGNYWSSSISSPTGAYYLGLTTTAVHPGVSTTLRYIGQNVRCVL